MDYDDINLDDLLDGPEVLTPGPNDVIFTQFLRPNGRTRTVWIEVPRDVLALATELKAAGYRFECEELTTGHVSITIEPPPSANEDDGPLAMDVVPNGPRVPLAVIAVIKNAHAKVHPPIDI